MEKNPSEGRLIEQGELLGFWVLYRLTTLFLGVHTRTVDIRNMAIVAKLRMTSLLILVPYLCDC